MSYTSIAISILPPPNFPFIPKLWIRKFMTWKSYAYTENWTTKDDDAWLCVDVNKREKDLDTLRVMCVSMATPRSCESWEHRIYWNFLGNFHSQCYHSNDLFFATVFLKTDNSCFVVSQYLSLEWHEANYGAGKVTQLCNIGTNNHLTPRDLLIVDLFPSVLIAKKDPNKTLNVTPNMSQSLDVKSHFFTAQFVCSHLLPTEENCNFQWWCNHLGECLFVILEKKKIALKVTLDVEQIFFFTFEYETPQKKRVVAIIICRIWVNMKISEWVKNNDNNSMEK